MIQRSDIYRLLAAVGIIFFSMQTLSYINLQWDLTLDQRYTLSENTVEVVQNIKQPILPTLKDRAHHIIKASQSSK